MSDQVAKAEREQRLQAARTRADELGVPYHHRAGPDKIEALINAFLVQNPDKRQIRPADYQSEERVATDDEQAALLATLPEPKPLTAVEYREREKEKRFRTAGRLIRIRATNMNPNKKEWPGELISTGSAKFGTMKKYVPFDQQPYHVPKIILDVMQEKKCSVFFTEQDARGNDIRRSRLINEWAIEILPPLTPEELEELARKQALAANGL